jgi:hypothetical protein
MQQRSIGANEPKLGGDELSAIDVIGCARERGVGHNVYSQRGHVRRSGEAPVVRPTYRNLKLRQPPHPS